MSIDYFVCRVEHRPGYIAEVEKFKTHTQFIHVCHEKPMAYLATANTRRDHEREQSGEFQPSFRNGRSFGGPGQLAHVNTTCMRRAQITKRYGNGYVSITKDETWPRSGQ
jgi:hypothetical protein